VTPGRLATRRTAFIDEAGREVVLRGVNLGGDCKVPCPDGGTHIPSDFADHREVSFVGRPFPLEAADEHLDRLRGWGFNALRLLTTWEAVEHAGPGSYDRAYLDYFAGICRRAGEHGFWVFVDFHQDVWSRMSGGDGAPGWTFEALGLDFTRFDEADAALVMQHRYDYSSPAARQEDRYPMMSWGRNYQMPANGICWTAFFAGRAFTPDWRIDGRNVQDLLQGAYLGAMRAVAEAVKDQPHVIGFDTLNEPGRGWIGQPLSERRLTPSPDNPRPPRPGPVWTPLDGLAAAAGQTRVLPVLGRRGDAPGLEIVSELTVNAPGVRIWRSDDADPFEQAGIWRRDGATPLQEDAFQMLEGRPVSHDADFMAPFMRAVAETVRSVRDDWLVFAELDPFEAATGHGFPPGMPERSVNANHWYDARTLVTKTFDADFDPERLRSRYLRELSRIRAHGEAMEAPTLIGEFGIPYDLNGGEAYRRWAAGERDEAIWAAHERALSLMYDAMDELGLSSTQWNYTVSNRNDLRIGDSWNQEDLSIFSPDQQANASGGGRAVRGFSRPYVRAAQGQVASQRFDWSARLFMAELDVDPQVAAPTELYVPTAWFSEGGEVVCDDPGAEVSRAGDLVQVRSRRAGRLRLGLSAA
jgi:hypothetical protein